MEVAGVCVEVADGVVNNWMPAWKQSAVWLIAPDMDIMAAVCPGALATVAALKRLLGRDEVMDSVLKSGPVRSFGPFWAQPQPDQYY